MNRMTTDTPQNNLESLLNYAFAENKRVVLRYADGEENKDLCEYISDKARAMGCDLSPEDIMDGGCMECDCVLAVLYAVATQAAELRAKLKRYEDTGLEPEEIDRIVDAYGRGVTLREEVGQRIEIIREIKTDRLRELAEAEKALKGGGADA